jgi:hypothetical protein
VHNLEHGYGSMYYRSSGDAGLPTRVVRSLTELAEDETKVLLAPYPDLGEDEALALVAWDELQRCPSTVTASQATELAEWFIDRFRG